MATVTREQELLSVIVEVRGRASAACEGPLDCRVVRQPSKLGDGETAT